MIVVVIRYKTNATARRALTFIVRIFVNDTIAIAVRTSFHMCGGLHRRAFPAQELRRFQAAALVAAMPVLRSSPAHARLGAAQGEAQHHSGLITASGMVSTATMWPPTIVTVVMSA
jgi:hypothetical protein